MRVFTCIPFSTILDNGRMSMVECSEDGLRRPGQVSDGSTQWAFAEFDLGKADHKNSQTVATMER